ncbi:hypothetical protein HMPREF9004_0606 [Schaalia cardiffensis F0333]|uniref:Uncharacterized protein n=1 Tax=Schaalia cardiffensis F0333 TaxID=888050 RepID=N6X563_9ACTO|nr:hypothetical protein HMPREF9004_0606 [Schaalia cardiffensis F0333]
MELTEIQGLGVPSARALCLFTSDPLGQVFLRRNRIRTLWNCSFLPCDSSEHGSGRGERGD